MGCLLLYKMETIRESVKRGMGGAIYGIASVTIFIKFLQIPLYTKISLVIWQDIGYTLLIPI